MNKIKLMKQLVPLLIVGCLLGVNRLSAADNLERGLWGEYFDIGAELDDFPTIPADKKPVVARADKTINVESTREAWPGTQLLDFFYIRWTGKVRIAKDGKYTFFLESDDGSRLFVDDKQIIDNGGKHAMEEVSGEVNLKAGDHALKIDYFEADLDAGCKFFWQPPGGRKEITPENVLFHEAAAAAGTAAAGTGLSAEYFLIGSPLDDFPKIPQGKKPTLKRVDATINVEASEEAWPGTSLTDYFFIRWTGKIQIPKAGKYTFFLESDDGSRLFVDGKQVIDNGGQHAMTEKDAALDLADGPHSIKIDYFENEVHAGCKFSWQAPGGTKEIVPARVLYP
jgi:hypothetical protein